MTPRRCIFCNKEHTNRSAKVYCSAECRRKHRIIDKSTNPNYKDGSCITNYGNQVAFRKKFPEKRAAHQAVYVAIKKGNLTRLPCAKCGSKKSEAHHKDYSKPLEVDWLCRKCHAELHYPKKQKNY